jgi:hypothetical protein
MSVLTGTHKKLVVVRRATQSVKIGEEFRASQMKEEFETLLSKLEARGRVEGARVAAAKVAQSETLAALEGLKRTLQCDRLVVREERVRVEETLRAMEDAWHTEVCALKQSLAGAQARAAEATGEAERARGEAARAQGELGVERAKRQGAVGALKEGIGLLRSALEEKNALAASLAAATAAAVDMDARGFKRKWEGRVFMAAAASSAAAATQLQASSGGAHLHTPMHTPIPPAFQPFTIPPGLLPPPHPPVVTSLALRDRREKRLKLQFMAGEAMGSAIIVAAYPGPHALVGGDGSDKGSEGGMQQQGEGEEEQLEG